MDLADKIIKSNNSSASPWGELDEYGLPLRASNQLDYTVARIVMRNQRLCVNPDDNKIYNLNDPKRLPLKENGRSVVELSYFDSPFAKGHRSALVFERLRQLLPKADMDSVQVCDGLVFDGETRSLKKTMTLEETDEYFKNIVKAMNNFERSKEDD